MQELEQFSVYNNLGKPRLANHPLQDLLPENFDQGWHVARNLLKPLNHLDFLRRKEETASELHLHNLLTPRELFDRNYTLLAEHQAGKVPTADVIRYLTCQLQQDSVPCSEDDVRAKLREYATIRHMEFHPSDVCNLTCRGCTYGHDDPETKPLPINFPFGAITKIAQLQPRSMVIIGGGEPTLYRSGKYHFQEMIEEVLATNPGIRLALVTNGTFKPAGNWPSKFSWIRLSLNRTT